MTTTDLRRTCLSDGAISVFAVAMYSQSIIEETID